MNYDEQFSGRFRNFLRRTPDLLTHDEKIFCFLCSWIIFLTTYLLCAVINRSDSVILCLIFRASYVNIYKEPT
jgi:hypothetical protein